MGWQAVHEPFLSRGSDTVELQVLNIQIIHSYSWLKVLLSLIFYLYTLVSVSQCRMAWANVIVVTTLAICTSVWTCVCMYRVIISVYRVQCGICTRTAFLIGHRRSTGISGLDPEVTQRHMNLQSASILLTAFCLYIIPINQVATSTVPKAPIFRHICLSSGLPLYLPVYETYVQK